jgi:hypothetical protein
VKTRRRPCAKMAKFQVLQGEVMATKFNAKPTRMRESTINKPLLGASLRRGEPSGILTLLGSTCSRLGCRPRFSN